MDIARELAAQGGAARWADLVRAGVPASALRTPELPVERRGHGLFVLPQAPAEVIAARALGAQIGCLSACEHWGLPLVKAPQRPHVIVSRNGGIARRAVRNAGAVVHRSDAHRLSGLHADPFDAIDQAARCASPIGQVALLDAAISRGVVAAGDVHHLTVGPARRREWVARHVDPSAESILESVSRCAMRIAGLRVEPQVWFGTATRVDFVVDGKVVVETDGAQHFDPRALAYDRMRDRGLAIATFRVMRFGYGEVLPDPAGLVREVCEATGRSPHARWQQRLAWALAAPPRRGSRS